MEQAPELPALGRVLEFMRLIWEVDHALQRTSKRMEATIGVTGPQRLVVRIIGRFPGIAAGHLARLLHVHPSTLTGIVKRLERQGLVQKKSDPRDGRRLLLSLSNKGRRFDVKADGTIEAALQRALERAPLGQIEAARALLASIARTLNNLEGPTAVRAVARP